MKIEINNKVVPGSTYTAFLNKIAPMKGNPAKANI